jgi:hypothetical protein
MENLVFGLNHTVTKKVVGIFVRFRAPLHPYARLEFISFRKNIAQNYSQH